MHTNKSMGERIGLSHSTVSRIRVGLRLPSIEVMGKIAQEFGWTLEDQFASRTKGAKVYAKAFDKLVRGPDPKNPADAEQLKEKVPS